MGAVARSDLLCQGEALKAHEVGASHIVGLEVQVDDLNRCASVADFGPTAKVGTHGKPVHLGGNIAEFGQREMELTLAGSGESEILLVALGEAGRGIDALGAFADTRARL